MPFAVCETNNGTCVCPVGQYFNSSGLCDYLNRTVETGQSDFFVPQIPHLVDINESRPSFSNTIVIVTLFIVLGWVVFTTLIRFMPLRGIWFRLRRFVRWCDYIYSKRHWMDEQKCQVRHKTEIGGVASIGATIFIIGFVISEMYLYFSFQPYTIQSVFPLTGSTELADYKNTLNFSITVLGPMDCSQWKNPRVTFGLPPFQKTIPSTEFSSPNPYYLICNNSPQGPVLEFYCEDCIVAFDNYFIEQDFVDTVRPAVAYGFKYTATTSTPDGSRSSVTEGSVVARLDNNASVTLRGPAPSSLNFRFVPRIFRDPNTDEDTRLIQAFFHEFTIGDNLNTTNLTAEGGTDLVCRGDPDCELQRSLGNTSMITVRFATEILSLYEVFTVTVERRDVLTFLASLGGLYKLGILLFFLSMNMAERYVRSVRYDDKLLDRMAKKRNAQYHWRKLRIAVRYGMFRHAAGDAAGASELPMPMEKGTRLPPAAAGTAALASASLTGAAPRQGLIGWWTSLFRASGPSLRPSVSKGTALAMDRKAEEEARIEVAELDPAAARAARKLPSKMPSLKSVPLPSPHVIPDTFRKVASGVGTALQSESFQGGYFQRRQTAVYRRYGYKFEDERKGSESEHKGMVVRSYRAPSWVPNYRELPHVPDFPPSIAAYLEKKRKQGGEDGAGHTHDDKLGDDHHDHDHPDARELFNFLVEMDEYQARLRKDFLLAQTMVENILQRFRPHSDL